ncbi:hypothetical protein YPPY54_0989, partial [Yersinia pestis PY-54]
MRENMLFTLGHDRD